MTLSRQHALTLPANPRAVKLARDWAGRVLNELGRDDLATSAELGVSELVTNAIMHSTPPVAVRLRGTFDHPRIEVADRSLVPPRPSEPLDDLMGDDDIPLTFGRGLALVALHSARWGSEIDNDGHGKTVWFEPVGEPRDDADLSLDLDGDLFDLEQLMQERAFDLHPAETLELRLLGVPVAAFAEVRRQYNELRRELRLLALANPEKYPVAVAFSEVALQSEQESRQTHGLDGFAAAEHESAERVDLTFQVPVTAPTTMASMRDLLEQVYAFFDDEQLLASLPSPRQQAVQTWYLEEYVRQGDGEQPQAWDGGYRDHRKQPTAS